MTSNKQSSKLNAPPLVYTLNSAIPTRIQDGTIFILMRRPTNPSIRPNLEGFCPHSWVLVQAVLSTVR